MLSSVLTSELQVVFFFFCLQSKLALTWQSSRMFLQIVVTWTLELSKKDRRWWQIVTKYFVPFTFFVLFVKICHSWDQVLCCCILWWWWWYCWWLWKQTVVVFFVSWLDCNLCHTSLRSAYDGWDRVLAILRFTSTGNQSWSDSTPEHTE